MEGKQSNIGVFDSGLGGLWILKHLEKALPDYNYIYYGDQAYIPYGTKEPAEITARCFFITDFLIAEGCSVIVVACNTATSASISALREKYPHILFVGIEPAVKPASEHSKTGHIGVLATKLTATGIKLQENIDKFAHDVSVHTAIGSGLVELVETGQANSAQAKDLLREYLEPLLRKNIDQLILGCTHYSFLLQSIREIVGDNVTIVDPVPAVAKRVAQLVSENKITPGIKHSDTELYTSGSDLEGMQNFYKGIRV